MIYDYCLMKWMGVNFFCIVYYFYVEEVFDYVDCYGVVVINEMVVVGFNLNIVGGIFGNKKIFIFLLDIMNDKIREVYV